MPYLTEADLVHDCRQAATAMSCYLECAGQYRADKGGQDRGFPDGILSAGGKLIPVEFKRPKQTDTRQGRCSLDQIVAAERRRACGVETFLIDDLSAFVRLANWARCGTGKVCGSVATVGGTS